MPQSFPDVQYLAIWLHEKILSVVFNTETDAIMKIFMLCKYIYNAQSAPLLIVSKRLYS